MVKDYFYLMRYHNLLIAQFGVICAAYILDINIYSSNIILLVIIVGSFMGFGNIFNDIIDIKTDKISNPDRPLPSNALNLQGAYSILLILFLIGGIASYYINSASIKFLYFIIIPLLVLYPVIFKKIPLLGNIVVSFLLSLVFMFTEGVLMGSYSLLLIPSYLIFGLSLIREIIKDMHDYDGDKACGIQTLCVVLGVVNTIFFTRILIIVFMILLLLPYQLGYYDKNYLISAIILIEIPLLAVVCLLNKYSNKKTFKKAAIIMKYMSIQGLIVLLIAKI